MVGVPPVAEAFATELTRLGRVSDLHVAGSLALGDDVAGVSDLALARRPSDHRPGSPGLTRPGRPHRG